MEEAGLAHQEEFGQVAAIDPSLPPSPGHLHPPTAELRPPAASACHSRDRLVTDWSVQSLRRQHG